jgi:hypothetical protein
MLSLGSPVEEAKRITELARQKKITLRIFGGVSFYLRCPSANQMALRRSYADIDFMGLSKQSAEIRILFKDIGYVPRERFNAMQGDRRLIFNDIELRRRVDVFLDIFEMCHRFNLRDRLEVDSFTISLADMVATKLQIIEQNEKDLKDLASILIDYDIGSSEATDVINGAYLSKLCGSDWGIYKTFSMNLDQLETRLETLDMEENQKRLVTERATKLRRMMEGVPKSIGWKMRARIGDRMRWYLLPEADRDVMES